MYLGMNTDWVFGVVGLSGILMILIYFCFFMTTFNQPKVSTLLLESILYVLEYIFNS